MKSFIFTVPGKPMGKQRPRFSRANGRAYTPAETANYENLIRLAFTEKYPDHIPTEDPVSLSFCAVYPVPKSWTKGKQLAALEGELFPGKPDIDNILKIIQDAGNNVIWKDDAQVFKLKETMKRYGTRPGLSVLIEIEERNEE
jgi:Holliday junction resolvase RusA-like endonuclease